MTTDHSDTGLLRPGDTLVFLGDSITEDPDGYVSLCTRQLPGIRVINAGVGGNKANDMLARVDRDVLAHEPDWVLVNAGVNDVWHGFYDFEKDAPRPDFDPERGLALPLYKSALVDIGARLAGAQVVMVSPTVIGDDPKSRENEMLSAYVEAMKSLAEIHGWRYCPMHEAYWTARAENPALPLTTDGVHITAAGAAMMARTVLRCLKVAGQ